jgi:hypothetical protein
MRIIQKIAKPCGIIGGGWGIVVTLTSLMFLTVRSPTTSVVFDKTGKEISRTVTATPNNVEIYLLILAGLAGLSVILAMTLIKRQSGFKVVLLWLSALTILLISLILLPLSIFYGLAVILLIIAAVGCSVLRRNTQVNI